MKENKNKMLVIAVLLISIVVIYKIPKLLINKNNKPLPEVKLREIKDSKSFAIMIQNENGYEEYNKDTWPSEGYKFKEAKCVDNNGSLVDKAITYNNGKVTLITNQTIYCTLYFDKKLGISALDIVASKPKSLSPNPDQGDMYRYQGTSELVNDNYICFGTDSKEECTKDEDHYMYRIIGITPEGEMKLIKQTPVVEEGNTVFSWFKQYAVGDTGMLFGSAEKGLETWPDSAIYKRLNGLSNGTTTGSGQSSSALGINDNVNANTNIFVDSYTNEYPYMNRESDWYKKIADHDWMFGNSIELFDYNGHEMYKVETGNKETKYMYLDSDEKYYMQGTYTWNKETDKKLAKIGLPYIHDLYFTYFDGVNDNTRGIPGSSDLGNSWILALASKSLSTMTSCPNINMSSPGDDSIPCIASWGSNGIVLRPNVTGNLMYIQGISHLPVFYLPNTIEMEGKGIETDPYRIVNIKD